MTFPRFLSLLAALGFAACTILSAQDDYPTGAVPVVTTPLADQAGQVGGSAVSVDLRNHLGLNTSRDTFVRFDMTFGKFDVELLPDHAPLNVANFLKYVEAQRYDNTIIHRSADFATDEDTAPNIVQGGILPNVATLAPDIETFDPVVLEYSVPNERGTLAAARTDDPNSATSSWYFNVTDNSASLGPNTGNANTGYTVYGQVVGSGMIVPDTVALVNTFSVSVGSGLSLANIPLRFFNGTSLTTENFVKVFQVYEVPLYPDSNDDEAVLTFTATSSNPSVVQATVSGSTLTLTPGATAGEATVTVAAETINEDRVEATFVFATGGLVIATQPQSQDVAAGASASLTVEAPAASGTTTYQWYFYRSGMGAPEAIAGATAASYTDSNVQAADMGAYFVRVTNGDTTLESNAAFITLTGGTSRLANLSTRGRVNAGGSLTPGFVLSGDGDKPLVVRAVGPTLSAALGGADLADPTMDIIPLGGTVPLISNNNWGDAANAETLRLTSKTLGAFDLNAGSLDAAVLGDVVLPNSRGNRGYTVSIKSTSSTATGIALAEVYDPEPLGSSKRLVNVSALGFSGAGIDALVPGFVIEGTGAKTMLVRVVGPSLEPYNVGSRMADPRLRIVPLGQSITVGSNDNWGGTAELKTAFMTVGAFAFTADNSLDAAVLVRLPPGGYTVVVEGASGGTGNVLVEAYEVE